MPSARIAMPNLLLCLLGIAATAVPAGAQTIQQRLAAEFGRAARQSTQTEPLEISALVAACDLIERAVELDPADPELWRIAMKLGTMAERLDLTERAVNSLIALDPSDSIARLTQAIIEIEQHQTIEERTAAYDRWLAPENRARLGPAATSRLMFELALLNRREGRISAFVDSLTEAIAIDPSNQAAMAVASGYFNVNVDDPAAQAELLIGLLLANPASGETAARLARLLLDEGAYAGASRAYDYAAGMVEASGTLIDTETLSDRIIAAWAAGRAEHAIRLLNERQMLANQLVRSQIKAAQQRGETVRELDQDVPLGTTISIVRAAMLERLGDAGATEAMRSALKTQQRMIDQLMREPSHDPAQVAQAYLTMATAVLWLGDDADRAAELLSQAEAMQPLSDEAKQRFDGWIAMRRGEHDNALQLLEPLAGGHVLARLGLAMTHLQAGNKRDGARELLTISREQPGTLIGVWCRELLYELLGQRVPLSKGAVALNELMSTLPRFMDRLPSQPTLLFSVRIVPPSAVVGPLEPWIINLELANNGMIPLAIDPSGPIRPQVLIEASARVPGAQIDTPNAIVVDIDRRLRLEPRERVIVPVDLRMHGVSGKLTEHILSGSLLRLTAVWNPVPSSSGATLRPGSLGGEARSEPLRINGERVTPQWVNTQLEAIEDPNLRTDIEAIMLLSHVTSDRILMPRDSAPGEAQTLVDRITAALPDAYARIDHAAQAWVLAALGDGPARSAILDVAQRSDSRVVRLMYLLHHVQYVQDPMLDAAARSGDPVIVNVAGHVRSVLEHADRRRRESATQN